MDVKVITKLIEMRDKMKDLGIKELDSYSSIVFVTPEFISRHFPKAKIAKDESGQYTYEIQWDEESGLGFMCVDNVNNVQLSLFNEEVK